MKTDDRLRRNAAPVVDGPEPQRASRPAPGKVTHTSKLVPRRGAAVQRKAVAPTTGAPARSKARSGWERTMDSWMDAAHRGATALPEGEQDPTRSGGHPMAASAPDGRKPNDTGLPDVLKSGVEALSGLDMSDTKVHYNSAKPAQLQAAAFAQGNEIHLGPGQEQHLPHEAWHVVQQKQGRVRTTEQVGGSPVNADPSLESEADRMGAKALQTKGAPGTKLQCAPLGGGPAQRKIWIRRLNNDRPIGPTSAIVNQLFDEYVHPILDKNGYKTYGIKKQLSEFIRADNNKYQSIDEFLQAFWGWLASQTRTNKRSGKTKLVLQRFDPKSMTRPKWPDNYKKEMGFRPGDNIRHVVRNNTLKKAVTIEFNKIEQLDESAIRSYFSAFADVLGVKLGEKDDLGQVVKKIYDTLYLNRENLFAGDGPMNQVIGFSADPVTEYGEELLAMGDERVNILDVKLRIMERVENACSAIMNKNKQVEPETIYNVYAEICTQVNSLCDSLVKAHANTPEDELELTGKDIVQKQLSYLMVPAEEVGDLVSNIGVNFGFDLIDGQVPEDQENIGDRQGRLVWVETELQRYINSEGKSNLLEILARFMGRTTTFVFPDELGFEKRKTKDVDLLLQKLNENSQEKLRQQLSGRNLKEELLKLGSSELALFSKNFVGMSKVVDYERIDQRLAELGFRRNNSDSTGFICLIDSIYQLLQRMGIMVNRETLIANVRQRTNTDNWQMLDILENQGQQVLRAVEESVHAATGTHYVFEANVFMVLPDNTVVPFQNANGYTPQNSGGTRFLNLLFINNNHYEPLFNA